MRNHLSAAIGKTGARTRAEAVPRWPSVARAGCLAWTGVARSGTVRRRLPWVA